MSANLEIIKTVIDTCCLKKHHYLIFTSAQPEVFEKRITTFENL